MKKFLAPVLALIVLARAGFPALTGPYLGQKRPGPMPEIFAPEIVSLGFHEHNIAISPDGKEIFFVAASADFSRYLIMTTRLEPGGWTMPDVAPFSGGRNDGAPAFSPDGKRLYFSSRRPHPAGGASVDDFDIWYVERKDDSWTSPTNLGGPVNSIQNEVNPSVASDGTIYFQRIAKLGTLDWDLYWAPLRNSAYDPPEKLPAPVNTAANEAGPFIAPDGSYLLFQSNRPGSYGIMDIYVTYRTKSNGWSDPVNLGEKVNSPYSDWGPVVSPDGQYLFFSSFRNIQPIAADSPAYLEYLKSRLGTPMPGKGTLYWMGAEVLEALRPNDRTEAAGPQSKIGTDLPARLTREIPRLMTEAGIPGLSIAVIRRGEIFWSGYFGVRSRGTSDCVDENTMFEAASITKTVTAYAAMRLMEQGRLDLDKPLHLYFPGKEYPFLAADPRYKKITARLVLTHTTGLPNWGSTLLWEPGTRYGYSGQGFEYLGLAIEAISGLPLQEFTDREIFKPLGMTRASYVWNEVYAATGASGHDHLGKNNGLRKNTEASGGATLLTTARDYAIFLCALLNDRGLKKETIAAMISPQVRATKRGPGETPPYDHISWGWGWGVQPGVDGYGFWHWGDNYDLVSYTTAYKQLKEGLVYFANSENGLSIAKALTALVFEDPQYSLGWLGYETYDDPHRVTRFSVEKAFIEGGKDSGLQKLREARATVPGAFDENRLTGIAGYQR
jgi:CubicO group peptidase (beta-lactamase class C family)